MPYQKQFERAVVLERAMHLFWERGYEATSMQDLVDGMGINRGSIYATFQDKHTLFLEVLEHYESTRRGSMLEQMEMQSGARDVLARLLRAFVEPACKDGPTRVCFIPNTAIELAARDGAVRERVVRAQEEMEAFILRQIRRGRAQGTLRSEGDPVVVARAFLATLLGLLVLVRSRPEPGLLRSVGRSALDAAGWVGPLEWGLPGAPEVTSLGQVRADRT
ncbi:MAG TPA: TetR/AcrR family transcriptional regulator [Planctomycetota bacterium]|nr:TetR/AcrR family transcriptional regulator [Planctomycetota bacterium]